MGRLKRALARDCGSNPPRPRTTMAAMDFETRAIHAGQEPDPATGAVTTPIYQTSTFAQEAVGVHKGYDYARVGEPDPHRARGMPRVARERRARPRVLVGIGATTTIMHLLDPGDHVVCVNDVYGGTYRMFSQVYEPKGYRFDYATPEELVRRATRADRRRTARLDRDADEPAAEHRRHRGGRRRREGGRGAPRRRQHVRDAVSPDARSISARTSSSTRRRSTSAATRTWSAASRRRTTRRSPSACASSRSRSAPCPARSTPGSCSAA